MNHPAEIIKQFAGRKVAIVGDLVADQFLHGTIERVSREAPVFILDHDFTDTVPGGAANAAANIASLGGTPLLVGLIGGDRNGRLLTESLVQAGVDPSLFVKGEFLDTTTKIRVLAGQYYAPRQQVIRIDYKNRTEIDIELRSQLAKNLAAAAEQAEAIVISDYNYGVAGREIAELAASMAADKNIPLLVDSRFRLSEFPGATSATPNQEEVEQLLGKDFSPDACSKLRATLGYKALLVTRGNKGMLLCEQDRGPIEIEPVGPLEPIDVTGAGDTVIAVYSLALASGMDFEAAARIANHAGGIVVMKKGTCTVSSTELLSSLLDQNAGGSRDV